MVTLAQVNEIAKYWYEKAGWHVPENETSTPVEATTAPPPASFVEVQKVEP